MALPRIQERSCHRSVLPLLPLAVACGPRAPCRPLGIQPALCLASTGGPPSPASCQSVPYLTQHTRSAPSPLVLEISPGMMHAIFPFFPGRRVEHVHAELRLRPPVPHGHDFARLGEHLHGELIVSPACFSADAPSFLGCGDLPCSCARPLSASPPAICAPAPTL